MIWIYSNCFFYGNLETKQTTTMLSSPSVPSFLLLSAFFLSVSHFIHLQHSFLFRHSSFIHLFTIVLSLFLHLTLRRSRLSLALLGSMQVLPKIHASYSREIDLRSTRPFSFFPKHCLEIPLKHSHRSMVIDWSIFLDMICSWSFKTDSVPARTGEKHHFSWNGPQVSRFFSIGLLFLSPTVLI